MNPLHFTASGGITRFGPDMPTNALFENYPNGFDSQS